MKPEPKVSEITSFPSPAASCPPAGPAPSGRLRDHHVSWSHPISLFPHCKGNFNKRRRKRCKLRVAKQVNDVIRRQSARLMTLADRSVREMKNFSRSN